MIDLDSLESAAKAATQGRWQEDSIGERSGFRRVFIEDASTGAGTTIAQWVLPADAAFLVAASPKVVRELVARVRELESEIEERNQVAMERDR